MGNDKPLKIKKKKEFLDVYVILFIIAIGMAVLTYIIPAGEYAREVVNGRTMVVDGSYTTIERTPVGIWEFMDAVAASWSASNQTIFMIFMIGAMVKVLETTGMIERSLNKMIVGVKGKEEVVLVIISIFFSILGATGTFLSPIIGVVPLGVMVARRMGYDGVVGFLITYVACSAGFTAGWCNVFTTGLAQEIAELPRFSGMIPRLIEHVFLLGIVIIFMLRYCRQVKADPSRSLIPDHVPEKDTAAVVAEDCKLTLPQKLAGIVTILGFALLIYSSVAWNWSTLQITTIFFVIALLGGLLGGLGLNGTAKAFAKGLNGMAYVAILPGMARVITTVMESGHIIDTIIYYGSMPILAMGSVLGAVVLFIFNVFFNFFVSSGTGQALTVMPLMVPMADIGGITRQVAVECYKLGGAVSDQIFPTVSTFMACLALLRIPYPKWVKWALPYVLCQILVCIVFIVILQMIGWS